LISAGHHTSQHCAEHRARTHARREKRTAPHTHSSTTATRGSHARAATRDQPSRQAHTLTHWARCRRLLPRRGPLRRGAGSSASAIAAGCVVATSTARARTTPHCTAYGKRRVTYPNISGEAAVGVSCTSAQIASLIFELAGGADAISVWPRTPGRCPGLGVDSSPTNSLYFLPAERVQEDSARERREVRAPEGGISRGSPGSSSVLATLADVLQQ